MSKARDLANAGTALTTVSATELGYLDGVTSAVQTQIDTKAPTSTTTTLTGTQTLTNKTLTAPAIISPEENYVPVGTGFAGYTVNVLDGAVVYIYTNATANGTINFRGNSSTTLASLFGSGYQITVIVMINNGATAYYPTGFTIDGAAPRAIKWSGGTAPAAGNASATDIYSFTLQHAATGPDVWDIFAAGPIKYA